jgi:hypothetical protein
MAGPLDICGSLLGLAADQKRISGLGALHASAWMDAAFAMNRDQFAGKPGPFRRKLAGQHRCSFRTSKS